MVDLSKRSLLTLLDFTPGEIGYLLDLAARLKADKYIGKEKKTLQGKNIVLLFEKDSTRTRCSFEVAAYDQGARVTYLGPTGSQMGKKESLKDTARVLGRIYDGIEYRGYGQHIVHTLSEYSGVPVWNGLTNEFHPTQALADMLTMREHSQKPLSEMKLCFLGDAHNNVANSLMIASAKMGMDFRAISPAQCAPDPALVLWGVITVLATTLVIEPLLELFPSRWLEWLGDQMKLGGWMMLTTVVVAPILEEILFRGILQESLTRKYGPWRGILIASAIFGIVHGIPQQALNAFFVGAMIGFIYYKTQSLIPCILIHALNNAVSYFVWMLSGEKIVFTKEMFGSERSYHVLYAAACVVLLLAVAGIVRTLRRNRNVEVPAAEASENGKVFGKNDNISPQ